MTSFPPRRGRGRPPGVKNGEGKGRKVQRPQPDDERPVKLQAASERARTRAGWRKRINPSSLAYGITVSTAQMERELRVRDVMQIKARLAWDPDATPVLLAQHWGVSEESVHSIAKEADRRILSQAWEHDELAPQVAHTLKAVFSRLEDFIDEGHELGWDPKLELEASKIQVEIVKVITSLAQLKKDATEREPPKFIIELTTPLGEEPPPRSPSPSSPSLDESPADGATLGIQAEPEAP